MIAPRANSEQQSKPNKSAQPRRPQPKPKPLRRHNAKPLKASPLIESLPNPDQQIRRPEPLRQCQLEPCPRHHRLLALRLRIRFLPRRHFLARLEQLRQHNLNLVPRIAGVVPRRAVSIALA